MTNRYLNTESLEIQEFSKDMSFGSNNFKGVIHELFSWFDESIQYSRLDAPFYPLQRSDIDTLRLRSGSCGDYANLVVSTLTVLGYKAQYAYVEIDCFGSPQDHICVAVSLEGRTILVDPTLPYRKWCGYDAKHHKYQILSPNDFESKMKAIEIDCHNLAQSWGKPKLSGILYAPWILNDVLSESDSELYTAFYLLIYSGPSQYTLLVYLMYSNGVEYAAPIRLRIDQGMHLFSFSTRKDCELWDDTQYGPEFELESVPSEFQNHQFQKFLDNVSQNLEKIQAHILTQTT